MKRISPTIKGTKRPAKGANLKEINIFLVRASQNVRIKRTKGRSEAIKVFFNID